uniref:Ovule protein n=1 Tax=Parascaris univalens TaxID=6257 RepID=A0A915AJQ7_PARUN
AYTYRPSNISAMSLDKTLENVNSSLEQLTVDVSQLLDVVKVAISILFAALVFMIVGLTILCCYVKCKKDADYSFHMALISITSHYETASTLCSVY